MIKSFTPINLPSLIKCAYLQIRSQRMDFKGERESSGKTPNLCKSGLWHRGPSREKNEAALTDWMYQHVYGIQ